MKTSARDQLAGTISAEGVDELALAVGGEVTACFKAYSPLLAVASS